MEQIERGLTGNRRRPRQLLGVVPARRVGEEHRQRQQLARPLQWICLEETEARQRKSLSHRLVVGNAGEPEEIGALGDRREKPVSDRDDEILRQLVVMDEQLDHAEHVLVVVTVDVAIEISAPGQKIGARLLPLARAEDDDTRLIRQALEVLLAQLANVDVQVEDAVALAVLEGVGDGFHVVGLVVLGRVLAVGVHDQAEGAGRNGESGGQVDCSPASAEGRSTLRAGDRGCVRRVHVARPCRASTVRRFRASHLSHDLCPTPYSWYPGSTSYR